MMDEKSVEFRRNASATNARYSASMFGSSILPILNRRFRIAFSSPRAALSTSLEASIDHVRSYRAIFCSIVNVRLSVFGSDWIVFGTGAGSWRSCLIGQWRGLARSADDHDGCSCLNDVIQADCSFI
jgi:hypothetical protein